MKKPLKPLHLLKPGTFTDARGARVSFTAGDIEAMAGAYDPALHEAPLVVGHPAADAPAYGWIESLAGGADGLTGAPHQVDPAFAELVRAGRFKKLSVALYGPAHPDNPTDSWYLRHVGFLGAKPPAVKGLRAAALGEANGGEAVTVLELALGETDIRPHVVGGIARLLRGMREWLIGERDLETADRVLPSWDIEAVEGEEGRLRALDEAHSRFAEPDDDQTGEDAMSRENEQADGGARRARDGHRATRGRARRAGNESPKRRGGGVHRAPRGRRAAAAARPGADGGAPGGAPGAMRWSSFAEGDDGGRRIRSPRARCSCAPSSRALPVRVDFTERSGHDDTHHARDAGAVDAPPGYTVAGGESAALHERVRAYAREHGCEYLEALTRLS